jgi:hypothetical protein
MGALDRLAARVAKIESAFAERAPLEPALIWRCAGDHVTPADRRAAAKAAGERGTPNARIVFTTRHDASRPDRVQPTPEEIEAAQPSRLDALRALLRDLPPTRARNEITINHTLGRIDAVEAKQLRAELSARETAA